MKLGLALVAMLWAGAAVAGDPVEGVWKTKPGDDGTYGHVQIAPCGDRLCGTLIEGFNAEGISGPSDSIGKQIVWDMLPMGGGAYGEGKIWAPDRNKTYASTMQLNGNTLSVAGCVLGGAICRGQDWSRVK